MSVDGVQISLASKDGDNGNREAGSAPTDAGCPCIMQWATANFTSTTNFVNVGQVIQISRDHNTVMMMENKFHVTQQNQKLSQHHHNHHQQPKFASCGTATMQPAGALEGGRPALFFPTVNHQHEVLFFAHTTDN